MIEWLTPVQFLGGELGGKTLRQVRDSKRICNHENTERDGAGHGHSYATRVVADVWRSRLDDKSSYRQLAVFLECTVRRAGRADSMAATPLPAPTIGIGGAGSRRALEAQRRAKGQDQVKCCGP
jgi:hypothetical protein